MIIIIVGVTGSGKSTVGKLLAQQLDWNFYDGDDFHSQTNIAKMKQGVALNDEDRMPWLKAIREFIRTAADRRENAVIACSALKKSYRRILQVAKEVLFVYLKADIRLVQGRLKKRAGHFMNPQLVKSQFDALEAPTEALQVDASLTPAEIVRLIRDQLSV